LKRRTNRHHSRRVRRVGRRHRFGGRWAIIAVLVVLGLIAMSTRVFGTALAGASIDDVAIPVPMSVPAPALAPELAQAWTEITGDELRALLEAAVEAHEVPAMAGAIVTADRIVSVAHFGHRVAGGDAVVTADDLWHLGSCTKAMTATLLACLIADGVADEPSGAKLAWNLRFDAMLANDLAAASAEIDDAQAKVTLLDLVRLRGAIPPAPSPAAWMQAWADHASGEHSATAQRERFVRRVLADPLGSPGRHIYSNQSYAIAGLVAERFAGEPYEALMLSRLATPLGITTMGFGAPETSTNVGRQPRGHDASGRPIGPDGPTDNPTAIAPASRVHMSMADWARFVQAHLRGRGRGGCDQLGLDAEAFEALHTPPESEGSESVPYAGGWLVRERAPFGRTLWHNGSNTMWYAEMWLAPEADVAVLIVGNRGGPAGERAVGEIRDAILKRLGSE